MATKLTGCTELDDAALDTWFGKQTKDSSPIGLVDFCIAGGWVYVRMYIVHVGSLRARSEDCTKCTTSRKKYVNTTIQGTV